MMRSIPLPACVSDVFWVVSCRYLQADYWLSLLNPKRDKKVA